MPCQCQQFPEGNVPLPGDSDRILLIKILNNQNHVLSGGGGAIPPGTVDPNGTQWGNPGQTYFNTASQKLWVQAASVPGNIGWIQLI